MLEKKIGFIGCGNMAKAIISGLIASNTVAASNIQVFDHKPATNQEMADQFGITPASSASSLASSVDFMILAVKPYVILRILSELKSSLRKETVVVSLAAGITLESLEAASGGEHKVIRVMPNTPALVKEAMSSVTPGKRVKQAETDTVMAMFSSFGRAAIVNEALIHAVVGVSGSAPAYVFMFIEAMADAAVLGGMPRAQAYQFAAQAVKGAAQMVLESGKHPAELKDMVCSPGGTTIEAVKTLEDKGLRAAIIAAVQQCMTKSEMLGKK